MLVGQQKMKKMYDKNADDQPHSYQVGDQVWLKRKCYKTGENRKLSPRRTGPWSIIRKLPNMVNFKIKCGSEENVVHYHRLSPVKGLPRVAPKNKINVSSRSQVADDTNTIPNDSTKNSDSSYSSRDENETDTEDEHDGAVDVPLRRSTREKRTRQILGAIPWAAIHVIL